MKRKHLILLPAFAAATAGWVWAARFLQRGMDQHMGMMVLDLLLLAHLLFDRLDRLCDRLERWPAGDKKLRLHTGSRERVSAAEGPQQQPEVDPRVLWLQQLERDNAQDKPHAAPPAEAAAAPKASPVHRLQSGYVEPTEPERLQLGKPPRLRPVERRSALQVFRMEDGYGLRLADHWLGQTCRGSDLINRQLPLFFHMEPPIPGGRYHIRTDGLCPARLVLLSDGSLELVEKGELRIVRG